MKPCKRCGNDISNLFGFRTICNNCLALIQLAKTLEGEKKR
jgi:hypothetical protein